MMCGCAFDLLIFLSAVCAFVLPLMTRVVWGVAFVAVLLDFWFNVARYVHTHRFVDCESTEIDRESFECDGWHPKRF